MELELKPKITVIGVGGAGGNAVNNMIRAKLEGVEFVVANTDAQALTQSLVTPERRIQLGLSVTQGLGAGSKPDVGRSAAEESNDQVIDHLKGSNMVFITGGMGGGTGTGAAPVIARAAREIGILTVGVVTKPFHFEGSHRTRTAEKGIEELQQYVDTLIIIPNQNLFRIANERTTFADAFKLADDVLYSGVRGVTDLMMMPGLINLDFADIRAVMGEMGKAMMGTGEAQGDRRALDAAEAAISNPLLDDVSMNGARGVLINITGGYDMTLYEVDEAANRIRDEVDPEANIIFGSTFDEKLNGTIRVSVVATGIGPATPLKANKVGDTQKIDPIAYTPNFMNRDFNFGPVAPAAKQAKTVVESSTPSPVSSSLATADPVEPVKEVESQDILNEDLKLSSIVDIVEEKKQEPKPLHIKGEESIDVNEDLKEKVTEAIRVKPALRPDLEQNPPAEKKRPTSLFERFTGVARKGAQSVDNNKSNVSMISTPENNDSDSDLLEIPAFLRRGNSN
jgi:cell division protein FtsZ